MSMPRKQTATMVMHINAMPGQRRKFILWQDKLNAVAAKQPGFVSAQLVSPDNPADLDFVNISRFETPELLQAWMDSPEHEKLISQGLDLISEKVSKNIVIGEDRTSKEPVTAVITSKLKPDAEDYYREWNDRMCKVIAKQRGSLGTQVQEPIPGYQDQWVVMARFDSEANLQRWLESKTRARLLAEIEPHLASESVKRAKTSFDGWFPFKDGQVPPRVWQQSALVLLVLFPVVALEVMFVSPYLSWLSFAPSIFAGNAISVALTGFILIPIAAKVFSWWIRPNISSLRLWVGSLIIVALYVAAIIGMSALHNATL